MKLPSGSLNDKTVFFFRFFCPHNGVHAFEKSKQLLKWISDRKRSFPMRELRLKTIYRLIIFDF